jgi:hypothetical protein
MDLICLPCLPSRRTGPRYRAHCVRERLARWGPVVTVYRLFARGLSRRVTAPARTIILDTLTTPNSSTTHIGIPTTHIRLCHSPGTWTDR